MASACIHSLTKQEATKCSGKLQQIEHSLPLGTATFGKLSGSPLYHHPASSSPLFRSCVSALHQERRFDESN